MARGKSQHEKDYNTDDTSQRCSGDQRLRRYGFRIKARPEKGPPVWERFINGSWVEASEENANKYADAEEKAVAGV